MTIAKLQTAQRRNLPIIVRVSDDRKIGLTRVKPPHGEDMQKDECVRPDIGQADGLGFPTWGWQNLTIAYVGGVPRRERFRLVIEVGAGRRS